MLSFELEVEHPGLIKYNECRWYLPENVMYFLSAVGLFIWLHNRVINAEEDYLQNNFNDEYDRYKQAVKRWLFF